MGTREEKSCEKCHKAIKRTENGLVCGLWCRKSFHNTCVGLTNSETRVVKCSKQRINFHCETCEKYLGTIEPNKLQNCVNNDLLELVQKILNLTNELSSDNSVINKKLDTVISSNTRVEKYILKSPKCLEIRSEPTTDNGAEYLESFSANGTIEIDGNNDTDSDNRTVNSASIVDNISSLDIASDGPKQLPENKEPRIAEDCSSNECTPSEGLVVCSAFSIEKSAFEGSERTAEIEMDKEEMEMQDDKNATRDLPSTNNEECTPSEGLVVCSAFSIDKSVFEGGERTAEIEMDKEVNSHKNHCQAACVMCLQEMEVNDDHSATQDLPSTNNEKCEPLEALVVCSAFSIEKSEFEEGERKAEIEVDKEELNHEVHSASSENEPERTIVIGMDDHRNKDKRSSLTTKVSHTARTDIRIQCTTKQKTPSGNQSDRSHVEYRCDICKMTVSNIQELKQHKSESSCKRLLSCKLCHKIFKCSKSSQKYFQLHNTDQESVCGVCYKAFKEKAAPKQLCSEEQPYSCSICNARFKTKWMLQRHTQLYCSKHPFKCSVCNNTFTRKWNLKEHLRLHSGDRPYTCNDCNKKFTYREGLIRHLRWHTGERPYSCGICNKRFITNSDRNKHLRLHTSERPYSCGICNKTFISKGNMKQHLRLHIGKVH